MTDEDIATILCDVSLLDRLLDLPTDQSFVTVTSLRDDVCDGSELQLAAGLRPLFDAGAVVQQVRVHSRSHTSVVLLLYNGIVTCTSTLQH